MSKKVKEIISNSIEVKSKLLRDVELTQLICDVANLVTDCFRKGGKVFFCGNGGSAADAQHLAAELSGRFYQDREPLFAEALHVNTSYLTAVANDYGYDQVYSRLVKAKVSKGDVLFCISTSGNSPNIFNAAEQAKIIGAVTVGMTGEAGGQLRETCGYLLNVPSNDTPRIQECHIMIGHIICELVELKYFELKD